MKALKKNIIREIKNTKSRFISIMAIIGLSTGFFTGVRAACPSMIETGRGYFENNNLMDFRLISTVGFDDDDINAIKNVDTTVDVMPGYMADLIITQNNADSVVRVFSMPEITDTNSKLINENILEDGRFPTKENECVIESYFNGVSGISIGSTITFNPKVENKDTTDIVRNLEYKVVGVVSNPIYITYLRGNTNIGDGSISFFMMIPPENFVSERYTNVYLTTTVHDITESDLSDEYNNIIDVQSKKYEDLSKERVRIFNDTTLADAKKELSDARNEYNDKKSETEKEINDGAKKLHEGEIEFSQKIPEGEQKIADAEKELSEGKKELEEGQQKYTDSIIEAKQKLTAAQQQYSEGKAEYNRAKLLYDTEISKAQAQLDAASNEYNTQYSLFYGSAKPQAESKLTILKTGIDLCNEVISKTEEQLQNIKKALSERLDEHQTEISVPQDTDIVSLEDKLKEYKEKLSEYQKKYDDGMKQLQDAEIKLNDAKTQLDNAKIQFQEKKTDGALQLNEAKIKLDDAESQLEIGRLEYDTAMTTGMLELQAGQTKLSEGESELQKGKDELEKQKTEGLRKLKESREKLATGKAEAKSKLGDAEKKLDDAQKAIDSLDEAKWYVYTRDDNTGYSGLIEDAERVDKIAAVFPVFFLIVAALVCLTTMSRMVEERRTEIGTLKALGYSNIQIAYKYFIYSASASIIGSIIGAVIGISTLPFIILYTYSIMYTLPEPTLVIPWDSFFFSAGTGLLCTCLVAVITCLSELKIRPATLMRPKAPKPGKRILLEHITPIWNHMSFTSKVTARNIFRYKARFLMTVIGVAGCTALIIGGLGLKDSISVIADRQYKEISVFDQIYALKTSGTSKEKQYIMSQFHNDQRFSETLLVSQNWVTVYYGNNEKIDFRYVVGEDYEQFKKFFTLRNRMTHEKIELNENGVVVNERLAEVIGASVGDTMDIVLNDEHYSCKISDITENYAGNYMYILPSVYKNITGKEPLFNIVYTQVSPDSKKTEKEIVNDWIKKDEILTVSMLGEQLDAILSTLSALDIIVLVLIFCAGMLAVVVLYNLTNINIAERFREIATIKVLGFYNMETANYIYRENGILTVTGALIGLPIGRIFTSFIMQEIQMKFVMFPDQVNSVSYIIGFSLTILFSLFVNFIMYFKMKNISMVESLKSIE